MSTQTWSLLPLALALGVVASACESSSSPGSPTPDALSLDASRPATEDTPARPLPPADAALEPRRDADPATPDAARPLDAAPPRETCGDGVLDPTEACDAGEANGLEGSGCRADCTAPLCGDGHRAPDEVCDDGNLEPGDGCDPRCMSEGLATLEGGVVERVYETVDPETSDALHTSTHFVLRWNADDGVTLDDAGVARALANLEQAWDTLVERLDFPAPYAGLPAAYRVNVYVSDEGWAAGAGRNDLPTPGEHPAMWLNQLAVDDAATLTHEFTHTLQYSSGGLRDSEFVGWMWESHAELMTAQHFEDYLGCAPVLFAGPHLNFGTTRNRYCSWPFWDFVGRRLGLEVVNEIWERSLRTSNPCSNRETPFEALRRNLGWNSERLNDLFGRFALAAAAWDLPVKGPLLAQALGRPATDAPGQHARLTPLLALDADARQFISPSWAAPQRWGYSWVRLVPEAGVARVGVTFRGGVQDAPARGDFSAGTYDREPAELDLPDSGWRWGVVALGVDGTPRYSPLQSGARAAVGLEVRPDDVDLLLVVVGAPTSMHPVQWDQAYYSLYRFPYRVQLEGAVPEGFEPTPAPVVGERLHPNGGGRVSTLAQVDPSVYVGPKAQVRGRATVRGQVRIEDLAVVEGDALAEGRAVVRGRARLGGFARLSDDAVLEDAAQVLAGEVSGRARVGAFTWIADAVTVTDDAVVRSVNVERPIAGGVRIGGTAQVLGDAEFYAPEVSAGVYYGFIDEALAQNPRFGRDRRAPEPEVTASLDGLGWDDGPRAASVEERPSPVQRCLEGR